MGIVVLQWKVKEKKGKWWQTGKKDGRSEKGRQEVKDDLRACLRVQAKHEEPRRALEKRVAVQCSEWEQMCVSPYLSFKSDKFIFLWSILFHCIKKTLGKCTTLYMINHSLCIKVLQRILSQLAELLGLIFLAKQWTPLQNLTGPMGSLLRHWCLLCGGSNILVINGNLTVLPIPS